MIKNNKTRNLITIFSHKGTDNKNLTLCISDVTGKYRIKALAVVNKVRIGLRHTVDLDFVSDGRIAFQSLSVRMGYKPN